MKKFIVLIMAFIIAALSSACYPSRDVQPDDFEDSGVKLTKDMIPETYTAKINDSFVIDAKVTVPDDISFYRFTATEKDALNNVEMLRDAFVPSDSELEFTESDSGEVNYHYTAADGSQLFLTQRTSESSDFSVWYFAGGDELFCNRDVDKDHSHFNTYASLVLGGTNYMHPAYTEDYPDVEIEGIDRDGSVALAIEKLRSVGIECENDPEAFALTVDCEGVKNTYENQSPEFTVEDEAYYILFNLSYKDMPISYEELFTSEKSAGYFVRGVCVVVGRTGIVEIHIDATGIDPTGDEIKAENLYNVDKLKTKLEEKFPVSLFYDYKIVDIKLEYACVDAGEELIFDPCWVCLYECEGSVVGVIYLNALTGELVETTDLDKIN